MRRILHISHSGYQAYLLQRLVMALTDGLLPGSFANQDVQRVLDLAPMTAKRLLDSPFISFTHRKKQPRGRPLDMFALDSLTLVIPEIAAMVYRHIIDDLKRRRFVLPYENDWIMERELELVWSGLSAMSRDDLDLTSYEIYLRAFLTDAAGDEPLYAWQLRKNTGLKDLRQPMKNACLRWDKSEWGGNVIFEVPAGDRPDKAIRIDIEREAKKRFPKLKRPYVYPVSRRAKTDVWRVSLPRRLLKMPWP